LCSMRVFDRRGSVGRAAGLPRSESEEGPGGFRKTLFIFSEVLYFGVSARNVRALCGSSLRGAGNRLFLRVSSKFAERGGDSSESPERREPPPERR